MYWRCGACQDAGTALEGHFLCGGGPCPICGEYCAYSPDGQGVCHDDADDDYVDTETPVERLSAVQKIAGRLRYIRACLANRKKRAFYLTGDRGAILEVENRDGSILNFDSVSEAFDSDRITEMMDELEREGEVDWVSEPLGHGTVCDLRDYVGA